MNLKIGQWELLSLRNWKKKDCKNCVQSLGDLWDTSKLGNICIGRASAGEEKVFEKITPETFPSLMKYMTINIQEAQYTPSKRCSKWPTPKHMIIKLLEDNDRQKENPERSKREVIHHIWQNLSKIIGRFLIRSFGSQKGVLQVEMKGH